ncbi:hypothetical protein SAMN04489710_106264 [Paracidovorax konjaci]|uniref:Uncharacterized protein n=1 Tax=Paracidovorax konjaci TaxID=32040 RepID=A0A1I1VF27_9BURK|nr:hypothetical protein SAMN04489710_106264 [Paracidovorax konjaci]
MAARSVGSSASSMRPCEARQTSRPPSRAMFSATRMATAGSSQSQPVAITPRMPTTTPAEVHTSVSRCRASPSSAAERYTRAERSMSQASRPLSAELATDSASPQPSCEMGAGANRRCTDAQRIASAAPSTRMPSKPDEKYSALWWPNGWPPSAGRCATVTIISAKTAPARFTNDSSASDSSPTEPVRYQADPLRKMVTTATATEIHSSVRGGSGVMRSPPRPSGGQGRHGRW